MEDGKMKMDIMVSLNKKKKKKKESRRLYAKFSVCSLGLGGGCSGGRGGGLTYRQVNHN